MLDGGADAGWLQALGQAIAPPADDPCIRFRFALLRDPSLPHDQMDNFPSGKADQIVSGLDRQPDDPAFHLS